MSALSLLILHLFWLVNIYNSKSSFPDVIKLNQCILFSQSCIFRTSCLLKCAGDYTGGEREHENRKNRHHSLQSLVSAWGFVCAELMARWSVSYGGFISVPWGLPPRQVTLSPFSRLSCIIQNSPWASHFLCTLNLENSVTAQSGQVVKVLVSAPK